LLPRRRRKNKEKKKINGSRGGRGRIRRILSFLPLKNWDGNCHQ
jgi:hypothetical protein